MKVLEVCAAYKPAYIYGGPTMSVSELSEKLVKAGISVAVFTTTANGNTELPVKPDQQLRVEGVPVTYFKRITKDHTHFSPALLRRLWQDAPHWSIIHIHVWWNFVSIFSCLVAVMRDVPVMLSPRGTLSSYSFQNKNIGKKWFIHHFLGKFLLRKCHVHVTSTLEKEAIIKLFQPKRITVLPNFVKLANRRTFSPRPVSGEFRLLFFSRIEQKKGLELLINALASLTLPYHLTIAGSGNDDYIESLKIIALNNHVNDKISWVGFQHQEKFELLAACDLFILPSYDENFGNTIIESLSVGTPVLISEHVGLADYVHTKNLGWICKTTSSSISRSINDIAVNRSNDLNRIRQNAPGIIYDDFDEAALVQKYINMYNQMMKND